MIRRRPIARWRRPVVWCLCLLAGAVLVWVITQRIGADRAVADWQAESEAIRKGNEDAAAIERKDAAAAAKRTMLEARPRAVSVAALFAAFRKDPAAAQRTYGAGNLEVSGEVARVSGTPGEATIEFVSPHAGATLSAVVASEDADLISLVRPGAKISVLCESLTVVAAEPELSDCHF